MKVKETVYPDTTPLYLALKKETKKKLKIYAAKEDKSMTEIIETLINKLK